MLQSFGGSSQDDDDGFEGFLLFLGGSSQDDDEGFEGFLLFLGGSLQAPKML